MLKQVIENQRKPHWLCEGISSWAMPVSEPSHPSHPRQVSIAPHPYPISTPARARHADLARIPGHVVPQPGRRSDAGGEEVTRSGAQRRGVLPTLKDGGA